MNTVVLKPEVKKRNTTVQNRSINLPSGWWETNYSINYNKKEQLTIYSLPSVKSSIPITPKWNIAKGDYRVKESNNNSKDFIYYRNLKKKIFKLSIYPVILVTILTVILVSKVLIEI